MMEKVRSGGIYLCTIYRLSQDSCRVRNIDIAKELGCSKPSVTSAIKRLGAHGLVSVNREWGLQLTTVGIALAEKLTERHRVLADYFMKLGLNRECAWENAYRIGSLITDELFELIRGETDRL